MKELNGKRQVIEKWKTKTKLWSNGTIKEENVIRKKGGQGILQINLNYKRKEQNNTRQWFRHQRIRLTKRRSRKIQNYESGNERRMTSETETKKKNAEIRVKMTIHALKHLKRK